MSLSEIFRAHGTDKDHNGYTAFYVSLLSPFREERFTLLEIGIGTVIRGAHSSMQGWTEIREDYRPGASLRAWRDYLPLAFIVGLDPQPDTQFEDERIMTVMADSTSAPDVSRVLQESLPGRPPLRFVVEDGSHRAEDQIKTLASVWGFLEEGGVYVIEDVQPEVNLEYFLQEVSSVTGLPGGSVVVNACPRSSLVVLRKR